MLESRCRCCNFWRTPPRTFDGIIYFKILQCKQSSYKKCIYVFYLYLLGPTIAAPALRSGDFGVVSFNAGATRAVPRAPNELLAGFGFSFWRTIELIRSAAGESE